MTQQPFSRPGAIDLSGLSRSADPAAPSGAPSSSAGTRSYTVDVDEQSFQAILESSVTAPVVLVFFSPTRSPESATLAEDVSAVVEEYGGRFLAGLVDIDAHPQIAQAMQIPQVPLMYVILDGPAGDPADSGRPADRRAANVLPAARPAADRPGHLGRHQPRRPAGLPGDEDGAPAIDPRYAPAQDALEAGDIDGAVAEYQKLVDANPADAEAAAGLAMAKVLQRTQGVDLNAARAAAAASPDDVPAQIMVADLDLLGGHVEDAFARLVGLVRRASGDERNAAREHLIGLFAAVGNDDPRVLKGRQALASALF